MDGRINSCLPVVWSCHFDRSQKGRIGAIVVACHSWFSLGSPSQENCFSISYHTAYSQSQKANMSEFINVVKLQVYIPQKQIVHI